MQNTSLGLNSNTPGFRVRDELGVPMVPVFIPVI